MKNWGFTINKGRQIDFDRNDRGMALLVMQQEPSLRWCLSCGNCTATCTAGINPRKINLLLQRGETDALKDEINKCQLCGKCQLGCPRDVNTRHLIITIQRILQSDQYHGK